MVWGFGSAPNWGNFFSYEPQGVYAEKEKQRAAALWQTAIQQQYGDSPPTPKPAADEYKLNFNWTLPTAPMGPQQPTGGGGGGFLGGLKSFAGTALTDVSNALGSVRENTFVPAEGVARRLGQGGLPTSWRDAITAGHEAEDVYAQHLPVGIETARRILTDPTTFAGPGLVKGALRLAPEAIQGSKAARVAAGVLENPPAAVYGSTAGAGLAAQYGDQIPGLNRLPENLRPLVGGAVGGVTPAVASRFGRIRGSILTAEDAPIAAAAKQPNPYQHTLFGNENTVKKPDLFGGVQDTGKTETELNGWRPGQGAPAFDNPPASPTKPAPAAGQRSIFDALGGDSLGAGVVPRRARNVAREAEVGGPSQVRMRAPEIARALGKTKAEIDAMQALDDAVKAGTATPEEVAFHDKIRKQWTDEYSAANGGRQPNILQAEGERGRRYAALDQEAANFDARAQTLRDQGASEEFINQERERIQQQQDTGNVTEAVGRRRMSRVMELEKIISDPATPEATRTRAREVLSQESGAEMTGRTAGDLATTEAPTGGDIAKEALKAYFGPSTPLGIGARAGANYVGARLQGDNNDEATVRAALSALPGGGAALRNIIRDAGPGQIDSILGAVRKGGENVPPEPALTAKVESIPVDRPTTRPDLFQARDVPEGMSYDPAKVANIKENYNPASRTTGLLARDVNTGEEVVVSGHHRSQVDKELLAEGRGPANVDWRVVEGDLKDPAFVAKLKEMAILENYQTADTNLKSNVNAVRQLGEAGKSPEEIRSSMRLPNQQAGDDLQALSTLPDDAIERLNGMPKQSQDAAAEVATTAQAYGLNEANTRALLTRYVFGDEAGTSRTVLRRTLKDAAEAARVLQGNGVQGALFGKDELSTALDVIDEINKRKGELKADMGREQRFRTMLEERYANDTSPEIERLRQENTDRLTELQARYDSVAQDLTDLVQRRYQGENVNAPPSEPTGTPSRPTEPPASASIFGNAPEIPSAAALPGGAPDTNIPQEIPAIPGLEGTPLGTEAGQLSPEAAAARTTAERTQRLADEARRQTAAQAEADRRAASDASFAAAQANKTPYAGGDITETLPIFGEDAIKSSPEDIARYQGEERAIRQARADRASAAREQRLQQLQDAQGGQGARPLEGEYPLFGQDAVARPGATDTGLTPDPLAPDQLRYTDAERAASRRQLEAQRAAPGEAPTPTASTRPAVKQDTASDAWRDVQSQAGVAGTPGTEGNPIAADTAAAGPDRNPNGSVKVPSTHTESGSWINKLLVEWPAQASRVAFSLATSGDLGSAFLQNYFMIARSPRAWAEAMAQSVHAAVSPEFREQVRTQALANIDKVAEGTPWAGKLADTAINHGGLQMSKDALTLTTDLGSPLLERLPLGAGSFFRAGRRQFESSTELMRGAAFADLYRNFVAGGREATLDDIKSMAATANHLTGATKIGLHPAAGIAFGAPRFTMAAFALVQDAFRAGVGGNYVRAQLAKTFMSALGITMVGNAAQSGGKDWFGPGLGGPQDIHSLEDLTRVFTSPNLGRVRLGDGDISAWGPLDPLARTFLREMVAVGGVGAQAAGFDPGTAVPGSAALDFLQNKASPIARIGLGIAQGENRFTGAQYHNPWDYMKDNWSTVLPIFAQNSMDAIRGDGSWSSTVADFMGVRGTPTTLGERAINAVGALPAQYWQVDAKTKQLRPPNSVWELSPEERVAIRKDHPEIDKYLRARETDPNLPDSAQFTNWVKANQTLDDDRLMKGQLSPDQWRTAFQNRNGTLRDTRNQQWPGLGKAESTTQRQDDLNHYFAMFDEPANHIGGEVTGPVDGERIDQATTGLVNALGGPDGERWKAVQAQLGWSQSPIVTQYLKDMQTYHNVRGTLSKYPGLDPSQSQQADKYANMVRNLQQAYPGTPRAMIVNNLVQEGKIPQTERGHLNLALNSTYTYAYNQWRFSPTGQHVLSWFKDASYQDVQAAADAGYQAHAGDSGGGGGKSIYAPAGGSRFTRK